MALKRLQTPEKLGCERGGVVVCIPVYGAVDLFSECLLSVLTHTDPDVPILVCDDATPGQELQQLIGGFGALAARVVLDAGGVGAHALEIAPQSLDGLGPRHALEYT